jgi:hypothetical protein
MTFKQGDKVRVTADWSNFYGNEGVVVSADTKAIALGYSVDFGDYDDVPFSDHELELVTDVH